MVVELSMLNMNEVAYIFVGFLMLKSMLYEYTFLFMASFVKADHHWRRRGFTSIKDGCLYQYEEKQILKQLMYKSKYTNIFEKWKT